MTNKTLLKNNFYEVTVEDICGNGNGIAKIDGFVVFIPNCAVFDKLKIKIIKVTKNYAVGKIEEIISPSKDRIGSRCEVFERCGGCVFQHVSYESECEYKNKLINDSFLHIAGINVKTEKFNGAKDIFNYRNKVIYPIGTDKDGKLVSGFFANVSHRIVEHKACVIGKSIFSDIKNDLVDIFSKYNISAYDEFTGKGLLRNIYMRANMDGKVLLCIVINGEKINDSDTEKNIARKITKLYPDIVGVVLNINKSSGNKVLSDKYRCIFGKDYITDVLCGKEFKILPGAFYQINHDQTEILYNIASEFADIKPGDTIFDFYCGIGTIGIILAKPGSNLVGVEISKAAAESAIFNAKLNNVNEKFICLDADEALDKINFSQYKPDVIILDPPRKGCGKDAVEKIARLGAEKIVYISCNPATLARDAAVFETLSYKVERVQGVDLFPRTGHVESVVLLSRKIPDDRIEIDIDLDELDITTAESKATYEEIKDYVLQKYHFKVSSLYIAQIKTKYGIKEAINYNISKKGTRVPQCPPDKEKAITDALTYYGMI